MATVTKKSADHETNIRYTAASRVVLVVAEEDRFQDTLVKNIREEGYVVLTATSTASAHDTLHKTPPSLVVLDSMISDGMDFCHGLRSSTEMRHVPILMIVANERERMYLESQGIHVDDYILKPLYREELQACVRTLLRRRVPSRKQKPSRPLRALKETRDKKALEEESIVVNDLSIDMQQRQALQGNRPLTFGSAMLFDLLVYLARHRGIALTREQLLQEVWGYDSRGVATCDKRTIDVHIHWLREVLCDDLANPHLIQTVRGVGYCFNG